MTKRGKAINISDLPPTEKPGMHPMPKLIVDGRSKGRPPTPWIEYLEGLPVGSSFVARSYQERTLVRSHCSKLDIDVVDTVLTDNKSPSGIWTYRMWIYGKEGNRNPMYMMRNGKMYKLEEEKDEQEEEN